MENDLCKKLHFGKWKRYEYADISKIAFSMIKFDRMRTDDGDMTWTTTNSK